MGWEGLILVLSLHIDQEIYFQKKSIGWFLYDTIVLNWVSFVLLSTFRNSP